MAEAPSSLKERCTCPVAGTGCDHSHLLLELPCDSITRALEVGLLQGPWPSARGPEIQSQQHSVIHSAREDKAVSELVEWDTVQSRGAAGLSMELQAMTRWGIVGHHCELGRSLETPTSAAVPLNIPWAAPCSVGAEVRPALYGYSQDMLCHRLQQLLAHSPLPQGAWKG